MFVTQLTEPQKSSDHDIINHIQKANNPLSIIEQMLEWSREVFLPFGELGLFLVSLAESSVFPVPPDVLLIPLVLFSPDLSLYYAGIATTGSVLGGIVGYWIGVKGGRPVARRLFSERRLQDVEGYFERYGAWIIMLAGFTPLPYKVFTITSGIVRMNMLKFVLASLVGRGIRFFAVALVVSAYGEEILGALKEFEVLLLAAGVAVLAAFVFRFLRR